MKELDNKLNKLLKIKSSNKRHIAESLEKKKKIEIEEQELSKKKIEDYLQKYNLINRIDEVVEWYLDKTEKKKEVFKGFIAPDVLDPKNILGKQTHWYHGNILYVYAISYDEKVFIDDFGYDNNQKYKFKVLDDLLRIEIFFHKGFAKLMEDENHVTWTGEYKFDYLFDHNGDVQIDTQGLSEEEQLIFLIKEKLVESIADGH